MTGKRNSILRFNDTETNAGNATVFSASLITVPKFTVTGVVKIAKSDSSTLDNKLDKGCKFFHKQFMHND